MKKGIIVLIILCMVFGLVACGKTADEIVEEKVEEKIEEIGDANDMDVDANDEDQLDVEDSENEMLWPVDKLPANLPKLEGAIIINVMSMDGKTLIKFEDCDRDEVEAYREQIKNIGWKVIDDLSADEGGTLTVRSENGELFMFGWDNEKQAGAITYGSEE